MNGLCTKISHRIEDAPTWRTKNVQTLPDLHKPTTFRLLSLRASISDSNEKSPMLDPKLLDDISRRLAENLPRGVQNLQDDLQRNLRTGVESALSKLNLVTREEFEIQQAVLLRTREKLKALEERVAALEAGDAR